MNLVVTRPIPRGNTLSIHRGLPGLFSFGASESGHAAALVDDEPSLSHGGEAGAVRVLYQPTPARKARPSRGTPVRDWIQRVIETLLPRAPVQVRVPAYARVRR